jgi:hypothetical protein
MEDLERLEQVLREEFENHPYTRHDLLGNSSCERKINNVIIAHILNNHLQSECKDTMCSLMTDSLVVEEDFENEITPRIDAYYKAKELIDKGYCKDLMK